MDKRIHIRNKIRGILSALSVLACVLLSGCILDQQTESLPDDQDTNEKEVYVTFNINTPSVPDTYAMDDTAENKIEEIDVLAFRIDGGQEYFSQRSSGVIVSAAGGYTQFQVTFAKDPDNFYRFVVLINSTEYINALGYINKGRPREILQPQLISTIDGVWKANSSSDYKPLPMWGESDGTDVIDDDTVIDDIELLRSLARVDVRLEAAARNIFKMEKIYVYNWKSRGTLIPNLDTDYFDPATVAVLRPSMPEDMDGITGKSPLQYTTDPDEDFTHSIYLHETEEITDNDDMKATCFIIGGYYDDDLDMGWYRVDLVNSSSSPLYFKPLLRNHLYNINIKTVKEAGYSTPEEAFVHKKANMTVEITTWSDMVVGDHELMGMYYLTVSQSTFNLSGTNTTAVLTIDSNYFRVCTIENVTSGLTVAIRNDNKTVDIVVTDTSQSFQGSFEIKSRNLFKKILVNYTK